MEKHELLKKFLANQCNDAEAATVEDLLAEDPSLLDGLLPLEEWDLYEKHSTDTGLQQEIWQQVAAATRKKPVVRKLYRAMAIAAGLLILFTAGYYGHHRHTGAPSANIVQQPTAAVQVARNLTAVNQTLAMGDGSVVTLYPQAAIQYSRDFQSNRTIRLLAGKAAFEVAADPVHAFTVYAGHIATTALGTRFMVDHSGQKTNVQLYEGKVVVKYVGQDARVYPTILNPGQQCFINGKLDGISIVPVKSGNSRGEILTAPKEMAEKTGKLRFSNVPLNEAFDVLSGLFDQPISYNLHEVDKMYFTGEFAGNDSLSHILEIFTSVNDLIIDKSNHRIHIIKPASQPAGKVANFTNSALEQVFREMESTFHIRIRYNKQDIANKYFTGAIAAEDDVNAMLSVICRMNQLELIRNNEDYQIIKTRQTN